MPKLVIIADDLTGANDAGVQFAKYGMKVQVMLGDSTVSTGATAGVDVMVLDTDSRAVAPEIAFARVQAASRLVRQAAGAENLPLIFKKADSTLRGNLGPEIDAALAEFGFGWAAVVPAFPVNGRITVGGWHLLHQVPIGESEIARDPKAPVQDSVLAELLAKQSCHPVGHVFLSAVSAGPDAIGRSVAELLAAGKKLISFDATTETHMRSIAQAIAAAGKTPLWVGCAGLAEMIPAVMGWPRQPALSAAADTEGPVLIVAGSVSKVTHRQMEFFLAQGQGELVSLQARQLIVEPADEIARCILAAEQGLRRGRDVLLASAVEADAVDQARLAGINKGIDSQQVSEVIAEALGQVVRGLVGLKLAGLFLTGGDTAIAVCRALNVSAIDILAEVSAGIPLGKLSGGICPGLRVVTKAGAFGSEQAIVDSVTVLKGR
jgi:uncharacterized protein YgbK (DUF1537 family)